MPKSDSDSDRSRSRSRTRKHHRHRRSSHHHQRSRSRHGRRDDGRYPADVPSYQVPCPYPFQIPYPNTLYQPSYPAFHSQYPPPQFSHLPPHQPPPPPPASEKQQDVNTWPAPAPAPGPVSHAAEEVHVNAATVNWPSPPLPTTTLPLASKPDTNVQHDSSSEELSLTSFTQSHFSSVSVVAQRDAAYEQCKATVERIARQCRATNRKFRDVEFDIESDTYFCLDNLQDVANEAPDVQRVPNIFPSPRVFYSGTSKSAEVSEGNIEDAYFIVALSTMTSVDGLVDRLCVARDEEVGIYGFIFHRDCYWVSVIIDDLLFIRFPKYEALSADEKTLYDNKKDMFDATRRSPEALFFARPPANGGETWIPLVEKAYAKLHGDYASIKYGKPSEAIEDLTGGVSNIILCKDILDPDTFWTNELLLASSDRLFTCRYSVLDGIRSGTTNPAIGGLIGGVSYSVIRAVEVKGKRFVVMRSPWGRSGGTWKGPWSDGSKEWTAEWLACLSDIGYSLGGDGGEFVMEYKDYLDVWTEVHRTLIFDSSWIRSSLWLHIPYAAQTLETYSFGNLIFTFSLSEPSRAVVVLTTYDTRYFNDLRVYSSWKFEFVLAKIGQDGEAQVVTESSGTDGATRSVSVELDMLDQGDYIVLPRIESKSNFDKVASKNGWSKRKLARTLTERAKGQSIAANYKPNSSLLPTPASSILKNQKRLSADKKILRASANIGNASRTEDASEGSMNGGDTITVTTQTSTTTVITHKSTRSTAVGIMDQATGPNAHLIPPQTVPPSSPLIAPAEPTVFPPPPPPASPPPLRFTVDEPLSHREEDDAMVFGLKVYAKNNAKVVVCGRLGDRDS